MDSHPHHRVRAALVRIRPMESKTVRVRFDVNKETMMKTRDLFWLVVVVVLFVTWLVCVAPSTFPAFLHGL